MEEDQLQIQVIGETDLFQAEKTKENGEQFQEGILGNEVSAEDISSQMITDESGDDGVGAVSSDQPATKRSRIQFDQFEETFAEKNKENITKARRLDYLLKRSEFFAHCLSSGDAVAAAKKEKKRGRPAAGAGASTNRHRKTEKEEDEELLKENIEESDGIAVGPDGLVLKNAAVTFTESPPYIKNGVMRDYQVRGLNWLINLYENSINGILADEMGLGKTLQTISLLGYLKHFKSVRSHAIVIVPKSTMSNWSNEFSKWCPTMRTVCLIGDKDQRNNIIQNKLTRLNEWDVLITTYEMVLKAKAMLKRITWNYLVIDEAHRIKNENSLLSIVVRELNSRHRLLLTGTPLQNNLHELWALLNFLLPDVFDSAENFDDWFNTQSCLGDNSLVFRLHSVLRPFLLRRIKAEVEKNLPPKREIKVYVPLCNMQRQWYRKILMKDLDVVNGAGKLEKVRLMNILMHLRKCSNHPYLFDGAEPGPPYTTDMHLVSNSGKLMVLDKLLPKLKGEGSRVLIFSQMTRVLDILEDYCFFRQHRYYRLDGQTAHEDRQRMIDEYNSPGSQTFIFMLSTRAGGLGINLASADVVVLYDSDWNPQVDLQAMDRAHRIGQTKEVRVFRLITENTVDEKIVERAAVKLKLDKLVIQQGRLTETDKQVKGDDLLNWIRYGANLVFSDTGTETIPDETIEKILERSKLKDDELNKKVDELQESNLRNFTLEGDSIFNFEGEDYKGKGKKQPVIAPLEWIEPPKRERKAAMYAEQMLQKETKDDDWKTPKYNPKPPKHPNLPDFQFFPMRLHELLQKEVYYYQQTIKYKVPLERVVDDPKEAQKLQRAEQKKIDTAKPLTKSELKEKEALLQEGYTNWSRRDFNMFLKLLERHGRENIDLVAEEFEGKEPYEVLEYAKVFTKRFSELKNSEKILAQITKAEEKRMRMEVVERALTRRIASCRKPLLELEIPYTAKTKAGHFTPQNDRFLLTTWHEIGFDQRDISTWFLIRKKILESNEFRFDWFIKSRNLDEIQKRCTTIWSLLEKDLVTESELARFQKKMAGVWAAAAQEQDGEQNNQQLTPGGSKGKRGRKSKSVGKLLNQNNLIEKDQSSQSSFSSQSSAKSITSQENGSIKSTRRSTRRGELNFQ